MAASTAQACSNPASTPRGVKRRREIASVAERTFFELGFTETTMQAIAARAGASKETLYRHFGSKEELFAEIVESRARSFLEDLDQRFESTGTVRDVLRALGWKLLQAMVEQDALMLCRTVIAETSRNPDLGTIFMEAGPDRVRLRLTQFLDAACARGELRRCDPELAARIFLGAVMSTFHLSRLTLQRPPPLSHEQLHEHVDEVVAMFMQRYEKQAGVGS